MTDEHDDARRPCARCEETDEALARAHAAIHWTSTVRAMVTSGMLTYNPREMLHILACAHAAAELWLARERVTADAVADLLSWRDGHGARRVALALAPLREVTPPLLDADGQPVIEVRR